MRHFENKNVLITGGASGIGRATALRFAREGAFISILDKRVLDVNTLIGNLKLNPSKILMTEVDVTDPQPLHLAIEQTIATHGELDIVFANAGISGGGLVTEMSYTEWKKVIDTNLHGIFLTCKYAIPSLIKSPGSAIVTMASSMAGWDTSLRGAAYMASKEGVTGLTKSLALQLGRYGVRVNAICPGVIDTPLSGSIAEERLLRNKRFAQRIPIGRVGSPEDVAAAVAFLASEDARHITGSSLLIDGGQTLQSWSNAPESESFPLDYDPEN